MPTYEYLCSSCGNGWETEQRITEAPLKECPACHQQTAKRQISSGGTFILKGGGWYADLYSSKKAASSDSTSKETPSKPKTEADAGTAASPAASTSTDSSSSSGASPSSGSGSGKSSGGDAKAA
jgi:putative FmdB family regulatory protein